MKAKSFFTLRPLVAVLALTFACTPALAAKQEEEDAPEAEVAAIQLSAEQKTQYQTLLASPVPEQLAPDNLASVYLERAAAARLLDQHEKELEIYQQALTAAGNNRDALFELYNDGLIPYYCNRGEWMQCREAREKGLVMAKGGQRLGQLVNLVGLTAKMHDFPSAQRYWQEAKNFLEGTLRLGRGWAFYGNHWQAMLAFASASIAHRSGKFAEAETAYQTCLAYEQNYKAPDNQDKKLAMLSKCSGGLFGVLLHQGKLQDAEVLSYEVRAIDTEWAQLKQRPTLRTNSTSSLVQLRLEQGKFKQARKELEQAISTLQKARTSEASALFANFRGQMAFLSMIEGNWAEADRWHQARKQGLDTNPEMARQVGANSPEWSYTLVRLGRVDEALQMLSGINQRRSRIYDQESLFYWEGKAFLGLAQAAKGEREAALASLSQAVPKLLTLANGEQASADAGAARAIRLNWIMDGYLNLLADFALNQQRPGGIDPADEAFRLADIARGSVVQRALQSAAARTTIENPELAALVRKGQDIQQEISMLSDSLASMLARGRLQANDKLVADLRARMNRLREQHQDTRQRINERFPEFAALLESRPLGMAQLRKFLKPGESVVAFYTGEKGTLVWAIPQQGEPVFHRTALGAEELQKQVATLRRTLDLEVDYDAKAAEYNFALAHSLYQQLLAPVSSGLANASNLIVVPHGPLGQLPFGVLTTAPFTPTAGGLRFGSYIGAPWLLKQATIVQLPSTLALAALRTSQRKQANTRRFVGFANPVFSQSGTSGNSATNRRVNARGLLHPQRRDLSIAPSEALPEINPASLVNPPPAGTTTPVPAINGINPSVFSHIPALPDTADEVQEIATIVHANPAEDLFLGPRASEALVKSTNLLPYQVVMFATHGLKAGDLRGLNEPSLALSNPQITGEANDGFLTLSEILGLKLNADWVVLSACNTASADGKAQEAVSGLGRAFFYAGARALLVSNWPVETTSARFLTTDIFRRQSEQPAMNRAQALRESSLKLMQGALKDERGQAVVSFAHPMFWAPFSLVGDAGGEGAAP